MIPSTPICSKFSQTTSGSTQRSSAPTTTASLTLSLRLTSLTVELTSSRNSHCSYALVLGLLDTTRVPGSSSDVLTTRTAISFRSRCTPDSDGEPQGFIQPVKLTRRLTTFAALGVIESTLGISQTDFFRTSGKAGYECCCPLGDTLSTFSIIQIWNGNSGRASLFKHSLSGAAFEAEPRLISRCWGECGAYLLNCV